MTTHFYLGTLGAMVPIPSANSAVDSTRTRGDQITVAGDGGSNRVALLHPKGRWTIPYLSLKTADQATIDAFYEGLYGDGPFRLVDPEYVNVLGMDVSTMGLRTAASLAWQPSSGTLTRLATGAPAGILSGVLQWSGASGSATLLPGTSPSLADPTKAPVVVSTEPVTVSIYLWTTTGAASVTLAASGRSSTGASVSNTTTSCAVTTTPQRFTVTAAAGALGASALVVPRLTMPSTGVPTLNIAAAMVEYNSTASPWSRGYGSPQVNFAQSPGHSVAVLGYADKTLALVEA